MDQFIAQWGKNRTRLNREEKGKENFRNAIVKGQRTAERKRRFERALRCRQFRDGNILDHKSLVSLPSFSKCDNGRERAEREQAHR